MLSWHSVNAWIYAWDLCSIGTYVCLYADTMPFNYWNFGVSIKVRMWYLYFVLCKILLVFFWVVLYSIVLSVSMKKNTIGLLIDIALNLRELCIICTSNDIKSYNPHILLYDCIFLNSFVSAQIILLESFMLAPGCDSVLECFSSVPKALCSIPAHKKIIIGKNNNWKFMLPFQNTTINNPQEFKCESIFHFSLPN